ncbi:membrane protein [Rugosibacter aromaticivorans]|uniref:Membrane protein n=1 Tax=Rugosibacter aromaticivorans TaxID=1565605 RepID=A0A0C5JPP0_9PROT|nr:DUF924 family protein [Rugosibacter aromaticivorans]AJP49261.1 membrane protein [Rugosibacter aromaticivorans]
MIPATAQAVLDFWFLPASDRDHNRYRAEWFRKDVVFDAAIRAGFSADVEAALTGQRHSADASEEQLAHILLLDQFTRNIFRNTPRAFAGDAQALALANALVGNGRDLALPPFMRWFAYLPFEHSESLADQERAVVLFTRLHADASITTDAADSASFAAAFAVALDYAIRHRDAIARFGRFPHRNAILGRVSTTEELEFLKQPGSSF